MVCLDITTVSASPDTSQITRQALVWEIISPPTLAALGQTQPTWLASASPGSEVQKHTLPSLALYPCSEECFLKP